MLNLAEDTSSDFTQSYMLKPQISGHDNSVISNVTSNDRKRGYEPSQTQYKTKYKSFLKDQEMGEPASRQKTLHK